VKADTDETRGEATKSERQALSKKEILSRHMEQTAIFAPFFTMIFLTLGVWIYMYARRIPFIQSSNLSPEQLTPLEFARISPSEVANPSDNLKNLFEIPTIFYALVLYLYVTNQVDMGYVVAAWVFVVFRVCHSVVHCTVNIIMLRFWLYFVSTVAVWFMAIRAALHL
jgi:hypothetical protein